MAHYHLENHVSVQILDFYHASGYLSAAAIAAYPRQKDQQKRYFWLKEMRHQLKHSTGAANQLLKVMKTLQQDHNLSKEQHKDLQKSVTYLLESRKFS